MNAALEPSVTARAIHIGSYLFELWVVWGFGPHLLLQGAFRVAHSFGLRMPFRRIGAAALPSYATIMRTLLPAYFAVLAFTLILFALTNSRVQPEPRIVDELLTERVFGAAFLVYASVIAPVAYGFVRIPRGHFNQSFEILRSCVRWIGGALVAFIAYKSPGDFACVVAPCAIVYATVTPTITMFGVACNTFDQSALAYPSTAAGKGCVYFLQISDIHATHPVGTPTVSGGGSGITQLQELANRIAACDPGMRPKILFDTGDVVDRGLQEEWIAPLAAFRAIRDAGVRVVVAPGNHDLMPSYDAPSAAEGFYATYGLAPEVSGETLFWYLCAAADLEPELSTASGANLASIVNGEKARFDELGEAWDEARQSAGSLLGARLRSDGRVLQELQKRRSAEASEIGEKFRAKAGKIFPEYAEKDWTGILFESSLEFITKVMLRERWRGQWWHHFPLGLSVPENDVEIFVLNSVIPEPRLALSARGGCGAAQLARLRSAVEESKVRNLIILNHHASFRFPIAPGERGLERWGFLGHHSQESREFSRILFSASVRGRQPLFLSGHIHQRSRTGLLNPREAEIVGPQPWIVESGAFGERGGRRVPFGLLNDSGTIEPKLEFWERFYPKSGGPGRG